MDKLKAIDLENAKNEGKEKGREEGLAEGKLENQKLPWSMVRSK